MTSRPSFRRRAPRGKTPNAFTLIELLVVIGIIALLIAILLPVLSKVRESSRRTACMSNLRSIGQAFFIYAQYSRDSLPNGNAPLEWISYDGANQVMVTFNKLYVKSPAAFHCPSDSDPEPGDILMADQTMTDSARVSYDFYSLYWPPEQGPLLTKMKGNCRWAGTWTAEKSKAR